MAIPTNYDGTDVRKILTGMVRDRSVCSRIVSQWTPAGLFTAPWANIVGGMVAAHFKKYGDPPNGQLSSLFADWARSTNAPAETVESIEKFLYGISDEGHEDAPEYLLDLAGRHFNKVRIDAAIAEAKQLSDHWQVDEARKVLEELRRVNLGVGAYLEPARDIGPWLTAFDTQHKRSMALYPGDLGTFFGDCFQRKRFFSFVAPDKTGKTHWLIDFAYRCLRNRQNVAYFDTGDGDSEDFHRRLAIRVSEHPEFARECSLPNSWTEAEPVFKPVYLEAVDAVTAYRKFHRDTPGEGALRFLSQPLGTLSVTDMDNLLDVWDRETDWRPDCVVIDYADTMAPPSGVRDTLDQIDETWRALRRLSQRRHCLVMTATQTSSLAYREGGLLGRKHFSGRKTKNAHVSGMIGINVMDAERKRSMARINKFSWRHGRHSESEFVRVAGCADVGNFVMMSKR